MIQHFTPQLLIQHLYNETTATEAAAIRHALETDEALQAEFGRFQDVLQALDEEAGGENPSSSTIHAILSYSKQHQAETV